MSSVAMSAPGRLGKAIEYLQELWRRREFTIALGLGNLKARNASTSLGLLWWVLNPLLLGGVYFIVVGILFGGRGRPDDFIIYLLSGMFVFHFTSQSMTGGANSIIQNAKLLANLRFPRLLLPISTLIEALVGFCASLGVLAVMVVITQVVLDQQYLTPRLFFLPAIVALHVLFNLGLAAITARLAVPFRDINNLLPYLTRVWLYLSPIIWPLSLLERAGPTVNRLVAFNPMYDLISLYRSVLLNYPFEPDYLIGAVVWTVLIGTVGVAVFVRYEGHMVRYL
ncbi:MAG TPA: ABC transporter permease [Acidimicrobiia bacterium]|nr:ABC transporter permease [Acidimicrobiia bacterium]